jgi:hypothetical protein
LPKFCHFLDEPPFFGFAALKERKNLSSAAGLLFCHCKAAPFVHQKKHLSEVSRRRSLIRRVVEVNYLA